MEGQVDQQAQADSHHFPSGILTSQSAYEISPVPVSNNMSHNFSGIALWWDIHLGRATLERSAVSTNTQLEATPTSVWWVPAQTKIQPRDIINYMEIQDKGIINLEQD